LHHGKIGIAPHDHANPRLGHGQDGSGSM
jgi:hypothetical protein